MKVKIFTNTFFYNMHLEAACSTDISFQPTYKTAYMVSKTIWLQSDLVTYREAHSSYRFIPETHTNIS